MTTTSAPSPAAQRALAAAALPRRLGWWYVAEAQLRSMKAYGWTIVASGVGQPLLYLLGIGLGLAAFLDVSIGQGPDGPVDYVTFVAPALLVTAAVGVAMDEFTYAVMSGFKWRRLYWGPNATPISPAQLATGVVVACVGRMLFTTVAYYVLMVAFGAVGDPLAGLAIPLVGVLAGLAFGLPVMAFSASLKDDRGQIALVQRFVFTPLFLFSGTFYPLTTVPVALQWIGWVSPVWHASEVGRSLSYGSPPGAWPVGVHLAVLLVMAGAGAVVAGRIFTRRLRG
ncbi:ABC transporter permease [Cellulomonas fimi]|uniref:Transport permease protein n=1 Tax=Cellulomonas fimi (strain ATCC 484 / DSM 20113 / JCM 1341 / CCUG 24087 / LMG 16345 / NBRC 15513 / NCIMB 8980 / NCTC 7547 / NRS-133) TaxID=590998 RepID=F4H3U5_CELFA|nr:ABC transporter permease [Cellulomonas fimi]AEE44169.1 ABC-2 type transporter [Cellulomonas fimi ATCC 484]NNH07566.1 ABC transporter permease [Cellulomonas fimi]VEH25805.1 inner membrane transport permease [Cellulomonas fimi]